MRLEPSAIVFYVGNLSQSRQFYQDLLGIPPEESSPAFNMFRLSNGMGIGLKDKQSMQANIGESGGSELAITVDDIRLVDELCSVWQQKGVSIAELPASLPFGYTFTAKDPDGNRIRVVCLKN
ncbi:VOC family protein [Legionella jordanis]|uniref:Bleomycin resistance protein n=1 Tax=Legionella jordanis TaxID=456 RepID=A0A0W0VC15_9GAMM|nr:VOC family protein [Legionella jordanis]KTD17398.1 bleomycin resistance protein [Legionella jordanis]RMX01836.1 hypothetical protein EAW55_10035 [Legionella jordanis]RMX15500.1 hypothetical protein EAS68_12495 [Legionella jordanis]VEH11581.1 bleomycin resistance protein [Legionella jordanis]HAT8714655.1 hypothetical protein [Legionella jordanis]